jgi:hypothetical protein
LCDQVQFNLQVRYAFGLRDMGSVPFELRTLCKHRQRVSRHMQETEQNLLEGVSAQVTDQQLAALELKTGHQRTDSVLVSSNMRQMTRLQPLVEPENEVQLVTQVQVAPNSTDDEQMAVDGLGELKARTDLEALWTDGDYNGPDLEVLLRQPRIEHMPTHVRGGRSGPDRLALEAFSWESDGAGVPLAVSCPGGQPVEVRAGRRPSSRSALPVCAHVACTSAAWTRTPCVSAVCVRKDENVQLLQRASIPQRSLGQSLGAYL